MIKMVIQTTSKKTPFKKAPSKKKPSKVRPLPFPKSKSKLCPKKNKKSEKNVELDTENLQTASRDT